MNTYVALLRGINVGGNNKVEMSHLKKLFEDLGFQSKNIQTLAKKIPASWTNDY